MKPHVSVFALFTVMAMFGGLAASAQTKPDDIKPQSAPPPNPGAKPSAPEGVGAAVDPTKYVIGPEDVLYIRTWREPDFTFPAAVRPDGKITAPLSGDVQAAGLTPAQLTKNLTELFGKYINSPDVNVFVQEVLSKKYFIDGEVNRPGSFSLVTPTRVLEALSHAGGFREFANTKDIKILRGDKVLKFNYKQVSNGKHLEQNILLENGDHIIIH
ncbi:MAG TPA: polysaccharide biosynthesis/export family protein [Bryobacteraceae bacterium]|nr:polysaccharide biosynthesis/export family protein [Bryobacteraceae bacterium]